jgi:hypothetical protein
VYDPLSMRASHAVLIASALWAILPPERGSHAAVQSSELVILKEGSGLYHRPGCPIVRDGAGVLAMTRAQAESREYKPHPDCDPANPKAPAPRPVPPPPVTVYVDGSKYYHRKDCRKLTGAANVKAESLETIGKTRWPCPECKPPVRQRSIENAIPGTRRRGR